MSIGIIQSFMDITVNSILTVDKDAKIYLCSDQKIHFHNIEKFQNIEIINLEDVVSDQTNKIKKYDIFKGTIFESNPLWGRALLRIFYLRDIQK